MAPRDIPFLKELERAELVAPAKLEQPVCRDPDDDMVLNLPPWPRKHTASSREMRICWCSRVSRGS